MIDFRDIEKRLTVLANGEKCSISEVKTLKDGDKKLDVSLVLFDCGGDLDCSCVVYDDGTLMHLQDWQSGYPKQGNQIKDYAWLTEDGRDTIIIGGLPRVIR
jgi:hypothetical protein